MNAAAEVSSPGAQTFRNRLIKPVLLRAYFLAKMPLAALAGLTITRLDGETCEVTVPFGWRTANPFGIMYFAAQSMAAELSCAGLALMAAQSPKEPVSVFPIGLQGSFDKRAIAGVTFTCSDGAALFAAVNRALETGESVVCDVKTVGRMQDGTIVSRFTFTWSFKKRSSRG